MNYFYKNQINLSIALRFNHVLLCILFFTHLNAYMTLLTHLEVSVSLGLSEHVRQVSDLVHGRHPGDIVGLGVQVLQTWQGDAHWQLPRFHQIPRVID